MTISVSARKNVVGKPVHGTKKISVTVQDRTRSLWNFRRTAQRSLEQKEGTRMSDTNNAVKTYCVWSNLDDSVVAIDLPMRKCIELMGISRNSFYSLVSRGGNGSWTVIRSEKISEDSET